MKPLIHGEYKAPGGKLVVADVEVTDGRGLPASADTAAITASIQAAARKIRRCTWRSTRCSCARSRPGAGRRPPTLRIWEWSAPAVVIGSSQSLRNAVDAAQARRLGMTVVRRISGGGAMFIEPGNTITYSLYAPESLVAGMSCADSYAFLDDWVIGALTGDLGLAARYQPLNDITSSRGKIGGAAQKRLASAVLHHVTMGYDIDAEKMLRVLRTGRKSLSGTGTPSAVKRVDPLRRHTRLPREQIIAAMTGSFRRRHGLTDGALTPAELQGRRPAPGWGSTPTLGRLAARTGTGRRTR
jgi:lipoate-protein ligase A